MSKKSALEKVKDDFAEVVKTVDDKLGEKYSVKNPGMVQHLMSVIQQEEDRAISKSINSITD